MPRLLSPPWSPSFPYVRLHGTVCCLQQQPAAAASSSRLPLLTESVVLVVVVSGESSLRNDLGQTYVIKFWLPTDNMYVLGKKIVANMTKFITKIQNSK
jgi:hypothetical protein